MRFIFQARMGSLPVGIVLLVLTLAPAAAQQDAAAPPQQSDQQEDARDIGQIHGRVTDPTGVPVKGGAVSLSTDGGVTLRYTFAVSSKGEYSGKVPLGEYTLVYRTPDTPEGRATDLIHSVVILPGKDLAQDVDMTRQEFIDRLSPEQQEQLRQLKESNEKALAANQMNTFINADLRTVTRDFEDAANARSAAIQTLGATASAADLDSLASELRDAKCTEIESLMSKATAERPDEPSLWIYLGRAELGLKNYLDAETSFGKAVDLASKAPVPDPQLVAAANAGLGEVYARTRMVDEANAAFAVAIKADPARAATYLRNLAVIFFQEKNVLAQIDAADEAIKANPRDALLYFIKAQGLAVGAPIDPDTNQLKLSPECLVAFREYLGLAPTGEYAAQVTSILQSADLQSADPQNAGPQNTGNATGAATPPTQTTQPAQK